MVLRILYPSSVSCLYVDGCYCSYVRFLHEVKYILFGAWCFSSAKRFVFMVTCNESWMVGKATSGMFWSRHLGSERSFYAFSGTTCTINRALLRKVVQPGSKHRRGLGEQLFCPLEVSGFSTPAGKPLK